MSSEGYVKLHRSTLDSWLWDLPDGQRIVAMTLLMMANWKDGRAFSRGQVVEVKRGQVMTSLDKLARRARVSVKTVRTALGNLEKAGFSANESAKHYRLITVRNFDSYQAGDTGIGNHSGKPAASQRQASGNDRRREEEEEGKNTPIAPKGAHPPGWPSLSQLKKQLLARWLDDTREVWAYHRELRAKVVRGAGLDPNADGLLRVAQRLEAGNTVADCRKVCEVALAKAKAERSAQWFNGVTEFRAENFARLLGQWDELCGEGVKRDEPPRRRLL